MASNFKKLRDNMSPESRDRAKELMAAMITNDHGDLEEVHHSVPASEMDRIFELADAIAQIQIPYQQDPLKMANEAITIMQEHAYEIAALSAGYINKT